MTEEVRPGRPGTRRVDPKSLRALAHPLRLALLGALREYGPATATGLAARLGESSGLTSYHLRQLATHDFVMEDLERGTRRERWWRAVHENTFVAPELLVHPDPEVAAAMSSLLHEQAAIHTSRLDNWVHTARSWSQEWQSSADISDYLLQLTPTRARALSAELDEVIARHRALADHAPAAPADGDEGDEHVDGVDGVVGGDEQWARMSLQLHLFPRPPS